MATESSVRAARGAWFAQPFYPEDHETHSLFPPKQYAVLVPTVAMVTFVSVLCAFVAVVLIQSGGSGAK
jgi:hypothetical protein